jgi:predicted RecB family nuclease
VDLDLHGDPALRRPASEAEEHLLRRGREHEAQIVGVLDYPEPVYERGDFATGAERTRDLMAAGFRGVSQGVLLEGRRLGIPDLLRREPGASEFGDWHYVVGDVKSSSRARADQVLQVAFYSRVLAATQGRQPAYAFLILKDGSEQRVDLADYGPIAEDVEARVLRIADASEDPDCGEDRRPFRSRACASCHWFPVCTAELEAKDDLSLLAGMTRGLRRMLEAAGVRSARDLADVQIEALARATRIEAPWLRRLKRASQARIERQPLAEPRNRQKPLDPSALVHLLADPFEQRVLWLGVLVPDGSGRHLREAMPACVEEELPAFLELVAGLDPNRRLLHYGEQLPRWFDECGGTRRDPGCETRFVDLARRLRGAASWPGPVFGLDDLVALGLGRDPNRVGEALAASAWHADGDLARIRRKGHADLEDLAALKARWLDDGPGGTWT